MILSLLLLRVDLRSRWSKGFSFT